eukprot:GEMP01069594.1.p1 GENE.GEMP01069594.1~~GEMP01069594.1.p1  ORF type:complete len:112 (-),score=2.21 GEMP01069594.1:484-819(-)
MGHRTTQTIGYKGKNVKPRTCDEYDHFLFLSLLILGLEEREGSKIPVNVYLTKIRDTVHMARCINVGTKNTHTRASIVGEKAYAFLGHYKYFSSVFPLVKTQKKKVTGVLA